MVFIGDHAWFYIAARDSILTGNIPLVGIPSSHPWLHQGPLWTYILIILLSISKFNPVSGAYFTSFLGVITVYILFLVGKEYFSKRTALIAAILYATSPLIIYHTRIPYHTAPIPFFVLIFLFSFRRWFTGDIKYFLLIILSLVCLYQLELATAYFWLIFVGFIIFAYFKKRKLLTHLSGKYIFLSLLAFIIPMLPVILYDFTHRFPQTIGFIMWIGYKMLVVFGYPQLHPEIPSPSFYSFLQFVLKSNQQLIFLQNTIVALIITLISFFYFYKKLFYQLKTNQYKKNYILFSIIVTTSLLCFFVVKTPSDAYLPMLFPLVIFVIAFWFDSLFKIRIIKNITIMSIVIISFVNSYTLLSRNFTLNTDSYYASFRERVSVAKKIVKEADGKEYNLVGRGEGSQFESYTMNYQYLTWWLGKGPSNKNEKLKFEISDTRKGIQVKKIVKK